MSGVRGAIYAAERVQNTERRFGSANEYLQAYLIQHGQQPSPLQFTPDQIRDAADRAKANPEDCPPFEPEIERFDIALEAAREKFRAIYDARISAMQEAFAEELIKRSRRHFVVGVVWGVIAGIAGVSAALVLL